ncbi:MAG: glucose-1-phosphate thymidylyltransferase RfbA [Pirellulaceae bacterium]|nr:glucose-1-phosphate thymidylyltransferase RfbA [Pirellulaceae bacterium]
MKNKDHQQLPLRSDYRGILLAGGNGHRLYPLTAAINKHLLPVYDKPMIYYSLSVLMLAGIRTIEIITTRESLPSFKQLLGDGSHIGLTLSYRCQEQPGGLAEAFLLSEDFIQGAPVALMLGDNLLYGNGLTDRLVQATSALSGATIFSYPVHDPSRFGVVELASNGDILSLEEKPQTPRSHLAVVGLYFYDEQVVELAKQLQRSPRGELEITDLNQKYHEQGNLSCQTLGRGFTWLDAGTHDSLLEASNLVQTVQNRQGLKIACLEEIAYLKRFISKNELLTLMKNLPTCEQKYLHERLQEEAHRVD